jgi:predicted TPR repeat methyltransferase
LPQQRLPSYGLPARPWPAETTIERAFEGFGLDDMTPSSTKLAEAIALHRANRLREAELLYASVLAEAPDHPDALHFMGVLRHRQNASSQAVALIRRAIAVTPDNADAHNNLGNVLFEIGQIEDAVAAYRRVVGLRPGSADAYHNLGVALRAIRKPAEAEAAFEQAITLEPGKALFHYSLGMLWLRLGRPEDALPILQVALALDPKFTPAQLGRVLAIRLMGRSAQAVEALDEWLAREPDNAVARHYRAAYSGEAVPMRASDDYVRSTFERYAASFDSHLDRLGYRAPQLLTAAVARVIGEPRGALDILDAGCGTGLCGPLLRPFARRLEGVDLVEAMLAKARERDVYDALAASELTAFVAARKDVYDVILSADTLVYFGDLAAIAGAAAGALRDGGILAFSLERLAEGTGPGYRLEEHGRYSHAESYVRRILADAGFIPLAIESATPRNEGGAPVAGLVIVARK